MEPNITINEIMQTINDKMNEFKAEVAELIAQANKPGQLPTEVATPISSPNFGFNIPVARRSNISPTTGTTNLSGTTNQRRASYLNRTTTALDKQSPNIASSYTQAVTPLNPDTCSVKLGSITCIAVFNWIQDMEHLQLTHPHELLNWGRFMKKETAYLIKSHAEYNKLLNRTIVIDSHYILLDNSELVDIILDMIKPQSLTQYITDLRTLVKPVQLPNGYIITNDWSWCYKQILLLAQRFKDALDMLNSTTHTYEPTLKSRSGGSKPGLIELFYSLAPKGKEIHNDLNDDQVKACRCMQDYLELFLGKSQRMYENSKKSLEDAAIIRGLAPLTPSGEIPKEPYTKSHNNTPNYNNTLNNNIKRYQHNANNTTAMTPYANPYTKKLNIIQPHTPDQLYNVYPQNDNFPDVHNPLYPEHPQYNNLYDPCVDENVYDYDYSEHNDYDNTSIINDTGLNPMYKVTHDTQDTGVNDFYALQQRPQSSDAEKKKMPCFSELRGTCIAGAACSYSHDPNLLRGEWRARQKELSNSRYKDTGNTGNLNFLDNNMRQPVPNNLNHRDPNQQMVQFGTNESQPLTPQPLRIQQRPETNLRFGFDINAHNPESMDRLDNHRRTPQV
jgi:hypothetical protein